jgi:hypothetical protein
MAIILLNVANVEVLPVPMLPVSSFCMAHLLLSLAAAGHAPPTVTIALQILTTGFR